MITYSQYINKRIDQELVEANRDGVWHKKKIKKVPAPGQRGAPQPEPEQPAQPATPKRSLLSRAWNMFRAKPKTPKQPATTGRHWTGQMLAPMMDALNRWWNMFRISEEEPQSRRMLQMNPRNPQVRKSALEILEYVIQTLDYQQPVLDSLLRQIEEPRSQAVDTFIEDTMAAIIKMQRNKTLSKQQIADNVLGLARQSLSRLLHAGLLKIPAVDNTPTGDKSDTEDDYDYTVPGEDSQDRLDYIRSLDDPNRAAATPSEPEDPTEFPGDDNQSLLKKIQMLHHDYIHKDDEPEEVPDGAIELDQPASVQGAAARVARAKQLHDEGKSLEDIAKILGDEMGKPPLALSTVKRYLRQANSGGETTRAAADQPRAGYGIESSRRRSKADTKEIIRKLKHLPADEIAQELAKQGITLSVKTIKTYLREIAKE